jgi:hypothetical protein
MCRGFVRCQMCQRWNCCSKTFVRCVVSCIILLRASNGFSNGSLTGSLLASRSHVLPIIWVEAKASATEYAGGVCGIQIIIHEYIFLAMTHYLKRISASTAACCTAPVAHFTLSTDLAYTYRDSHSSNSRSLPSCWRLPENTDDGVHQDGTVCVLVHVDTWVIKDKCNLP